jgi:hypothetical protein
MNNTATPTNHAPAIRSDGWLTALQQQATEALQKTMTALAAQRHHAWSRDEIEEAFA